MSSHPMLPSVVACCALILASPLPAGAQAIAQHAYIKASNPGIFDEFGVAVAVSGDTVVVGSRGEDSISTGVNGSQANNSAPGAGAVYVLVRDGTSWSQQAYIKASNTDVNDFFGYSVAIDGDTLVVGVRNEDSNATGINGNQADNSAIGAGAVYVFVRTGTTWSQQAYLKASNTDANDFFGYPVAISGDTVVVGAIQEDSNASGVNGNDADDSADDSGAAYVFVRNGTTWSQQAYLKASNTESFDWFGFSVGISGDTVVVGAGFEDSDATGSNGHQANNNADSSGAAYVFVRSGSTWSQQAYLKASNTGADDAFGSSAAISGDTVVIGAAITLQAFAFGESSSSTGVDGAQGNDDAPGAGAAYVFVRNGTTWSQQAYLKASNTDAGDQFGVAVAVSGDTVVVGADNEDSVATGIDGDGGDDSAAEAGAAYVFARSGTTWSQQAYVKASNTDPSDRFAAVSVSDGLVVVGALGESSTSPGVNGDQSIDIQTSSGAAYVFELDPWTDVGGGTSGVAGPPVLTMSGTLGPSSVLTLDLDDGAPAALALLFVSFSSTPAAFLGGTLHAFPYTDLVFLGTDGAGGILGSVLFPDVPAGLALWFQVGIADASVPIYGASLSNGVMGVVP